jgi:hypothetical protein
MHFQRRLGFFESLQPTACIYEMNRIALSRAQRLRAQADHERAEYFTLRGNSRAPAPL